MISHITWPRQRRLVYPWMYKVPPTPTEYLLQQNDTSSQGGYIWRSQWVPYWCHLAPFTTGNTAVIYLGRFSSALRISPKGIWWRTGMQFIANPNRIVYCLHTKGRFTNCIGWTNVEIMAATSNKPHPHPTPKKIKIKKADLITHSSPNFIGGIGKTPLKLRNAWVVIFRMKQ